MRVTMTRSLVVEDERDVPVRELTKQHRIIAYKMVDEILSRQIPAVVARHHFVDTPPELESAISDRVYHILDNLRSDAKDLWDES